MTVTHDQGASIFILSIAPEVGGGTNDITYSNGVVSNCTFNMDENSGKCVEEVEFPDIADNSSGGWKIIATTTTTTTYGGSLVPYATVTTSLGNKVAVTLTSLTAAMLVSMGLLVVLL